LFPNLLEFELGSSTKRLQSRINLPNLTSTKSSPAKLARTYYHSLAPLPSCLSTKRPSAEFSKKLISKIAIQCPMLFFIKRVLGECTQKCYFLSFSNTRRHTLLLHFPSTHTHTRTRTRTHTHTHTYT